MTGIGLCLPQLGPHVTLDAVRTFCARADEVGYSSLWVQDHFLWPIEPRRGYRADRRTTATTVQVGSGPDRATDGGGSMDRTGSARHQCARGRQPLAGTLSPASGHYRCVVGWSTSCRSRCWLERRGARSVRHRHQPRGDGESTTSCRRCWRAGAKIRSNITARSSISLPRSCSPSLCNNLDQNCCRACGHRLVWSAPDFTTTGGTRPDGRCRKWRRP